MSRLKLTVANAGDYFSPSDVTIIRSGVRAAERFMGKHFELDYDIDIVVTAPSYLLPIIPEDGLSGRTYNSRLIVLVIDTQAKPVSTDFVFETVCHELSHSLRWQKLPDRADTLLKAIIFEGLATVLEEAAFHHTKRTSSQFFLQEMQQTDESTINHIRTILEPSFNDSSYDYGAIFFDGNAELPRWAGYRLGYWYVRQLLEKPDVDIFSLTLAPYAELTEQ